MMLALDHVIIGWQLVLEGLEEFLDVLWNGIGMTGGIVAWETDRDGAVIEKELGKEIVGVNTEEVVMV